MKAAALDSPFKIFILNMYLMDVFQNVYILRILDFRVFIFTWA